MILLIHESHHHFLGIHSFSIHFWKIRVSPSWAATRKRWLASKWPQRLQWVQPRPPCCRRRRWDPGTMWTNHREMWISGGKTLVKTMVKPWWKSFLHIITLYNCDPSACFLCCRSLRLAGGRIGFPRPSRLVLCCYDISVVIQWLSWYTRCHCWQQSCSQFLQTRSNFQICRTPMFDA